MRKFFNQDEIVKWKKIHLKLNQALSNSNNNYIEIDPEEAKQLSRLIDDVLKLDLVVIEKKAGLKNFDQKILLKTEIKSLSGTL